MGLSICYKVKLRLWLSWPGPVQLMFSKAKRGDGGCVLSCGLGAWATVGLPQGLLGIHPVVLRFPRAQGKSWLL